jgi:WD40 repeat protein
VSHQSTVWSIDFDESGYRLASCSDDKTVKIWHRFDVDNEQGAMHDEIRFTNCARVCDVMLWSGLAVDTIAGVVVPARRDSVWKCCTTLSGHHSRPVFDVSW